MNLAHETGVNKLDEILVSIICITYNHEKYIVDALESFLMQKTSFKYEVLIHDDASTDRTAEIIREYEKRYPDVIKPIYQKENQYSRGVKKINYRYNHTRAQGRYVAICEGDDYWIDPYKLQKQVDYMQSNPNCSLCFHAADIIKEGKGKIGEIKPYEKDCISPTEDIILGDGGFMATNSIIYRKDAMDNPPEFYFDAPVGDYPLQIITSTKTYAYYINEIMSVYRTGVKGSWSSRMALDKNKEDKIINLNLNIIKMLNDFDKYSNGKYSNDIKKKILHNEFQILKIKRNIKGLKSAKYKTIYNCLEIKEKIKIYTRCYLPNIYMKLVDIKEKL